MPSDAADRTDGEAGRADARGRRPLPEIRAETHAQASPLREQIMAAALSASGELGYRKLTVAAVIERYGGYRVEFYRHFANLEECYAAAHRVHAQRLQGRLLKAGAAAGSWRAGLRAGLEELARFTAEQPLATRGLLVEAHVAGGPALRHRKEVLERLSHAIDSARRETGSRHSPPPLTASFMVGAIESTVVRALIAGEPERLRQAVPELEHLVCAAYGLRYPKDSGQVFK